MCVAKNDFIKCILYENGDIWFIITILSRTDVVVKSTTFVCLTRRHMLHVKFKSTLILFETSNKER